MEIIENRVVEELIKRNYKISTAESCTGGLLSATLINVPDASKIIDMSFVTYSNQAKIDLVNVSPITLERYGAVSEQTAIEMARGTAKKSNANVGLSTSGIAGPGGGTATKPVGMVCFGIYINGKEYTYTNIFKNMQRNEVRMESVKFILCKLYELLIEENL